MGIVPCRCPLCQRARRWVIAYLQLPSPAGDPSQGFGDFVPGLCSTGVSSELVLGSRLKEGIFAISTAAGCFDTLVSSCCPAIAAKLLYQGGPPGKTSCHWKQLRWPPVTALQAVNSLEIPGSDSGFDRVYMY